MFKLNDDIVFEGTPTKKDLIKAANILFKDKWTRSYSYLKTKPISSKSINIEKALPYVNNRIELLKYLEYLIELSISVDSSQGNLHLEIPSDIHEEINYWNYVRGGYCIYMSTLLYGLLTRNKIVDTKNISYFQGFYDFKTPDTNEFVIAKMIFGERQMGIHAWVTLKDSLIDLTASQNKTVFDFEFGDTPVIIGKYPSGYNLFGFKENEETIEWYWKKFAEYRGMSVDEWFSMHEEVCEKLLNAK